MSSVQSTSPALTCLIAFLIRPLVLAQYPVATVSNLQFMLQASLDAFFPLGASSNTRPSFSFLLSPTSQPPAPILSAALAANMSWDEWIALLGACNGVQDTEVLVTPTSVSVRIGGGMVVTIWKEQELDSKDVPAISNLKKGGVSRLRFPSQVLGSAVFRRVSSSEEVPQIKLPSLVTLPPTPSSATAVYDDDTSSDSDSESDFSDFSMSGYSDGKESVTTAPSSPSSIVLDLPIIPYSSASVRKVAPVVDKSKAELTKYLYQGGSTGVVGGGVMLGAGLAAKPMRAPAPSPMPPARSAPAPKKTEVPKRKANPPSKANSSSNWRRRSPVLIAPEGNWRERRSA